MALHGALTTSDGIHVPYAWTYASATSREGATGFVSGDVGKFARQLDDDSIWMLITVTPTWVQVSAGGTAPEITHLTMLARKGSSGTIPKGAAVYVSGWNVGGWVEIELARADSASTMAAVGAAAEAITNAADGLVTLAGQIADVDTSGWAVGTMLFVSASVAGAFTSTRPTGATALVQPKAMVLRQDASSGMLLLCGSGRPLMLPNLSQGKYWVGDASNQAVEATPLALSATAPVNVTKTTASAGSATEASKQDHKHDISTGTPVATGTANAEGTATTLARSDHVHEHVRGSRQQDAASEGTSSTSSEAFVQKIRLTTPSIPAGRYRVGWHYEWNYASAANDALVQVQVDDTTTLMEMCQEPSDAGTDQWNNKSGFGYIDLTAATHFIDLDYRAGNALYSIAIRRARLEFWRVS